MQKMQILLFLVDCRVPGIVHLQSSTAHFLQISPPHSMEGHGSCKTSYIPKRPWQLYAVAQSCDLAVKKIKFCSPQAKQWLQTVGLSKVTKKQQAPKGNLSF